MFLLQYWDLRSPTPAHTLTLPERCYTMDVKGPLMVIGTAERHILIYDLNNPSTPFKVCNISETRLFNHH